MLKIKDDFDLKGLEKFGYERYFSDIEPCGNGTYFKFVSPKCFVAINSNNRRIGKIQTYQKNEYFTMFYKESVLKQKDIADLITSGIVEKVEK